MKFSDQWLRKWVDHGLSPEQLGHRLTMAGLELDGIEPAAPAFSGVVVGHVLAVEPHPDADKLRVCQVEDGSEETAQVVCGAPNVHVGMRVPFARIGAVLPGDFRIKKAKLRGVASQGMLCSAKELGLAEASEGLMPLPSDAPTGADLRDYLGLDDAILEVDLTPNRADCLSLAGIARETALLTGRPLHVPDIDPVPAAQSARLAIDIQAPAACPRYAGRVIQGVNPQAATPLWLKERLRRSGIRSISPLVDVTNYVLIELGQPMHAFDLAKLDGGIVVRMAQAGEALTLLDGQTVTLDPDVLVIADQRAAQAMAGVMGGEGSAVSDATTDIFLESAFFAPEAIAGRARRHGLHTDSSHRFERGVDPALQVRALERATQLVLDICGGRPGPVVDIESEAGQERQAISLRAARIERLLGAQIAEEEVDGILDRLGCRVHPVAGGWQVTPPSFRFDLAIEADLIEEIARVHGYDNLPSRAHPYAPAIRPEPEARVAVDRLRELLVDRGYQEAITFSFVDPAMEALFAPAAEPLRLANPISSELAVMRSTLWAGLVKAVQHNLNRQQDRVRLFETGLSFVGQGEALMQTPQLAGILCGDVLPEQWGAPARPADFFDLKGDVEALLGLAHLGERVEYRVESHPALHPGQSARIHLDGRPIGWLGALHPVLEKTLDLGRRTFVFELELNEITKGCVAKFEPLSKFPAIRRDIAVLVDEAVQASQLAAAIRACGIPELREFHVFDTYTGKGVPTGRKSLALGLILQDLSRTLTDDEVESIVKTVVARLGDDVGADLRV